MKGEMTLRKGLTDKMKVNINMLGASKESGIGREVNSTLVITEK